MRCLGIDTATSRGSLAIAEEGRIVALEALRERGRHAAEVLPGVEALLHRAGWSSRDLRGIGVALGPGSFTGVRVGMATAKGIAYALDIGLAGVSTLEALAVAAYQARPDAPSFAAVLEAGRGEVYAAWFRVENGVVVRAVPDRSWRPAELAAALPAGVALAGDGAETVRRAAGGRTFEVLEPWPPIAGAIALHAEANLPPRGRYRPGGLSPNYVRPSDAEAARRS